MKPTTLAGMAIAGWVLLSATTGCVFGPKALELSRVRYNEVIAQTTNEQLLLNLVRLQYRESPLFLGVGSVSAQFEFGQSANLGGTINEGPNPINPDQLGLDAGISYGEKPTISFAPLQGSEFVTQILSPLSLDAVLMLSNSGWSIDRVLRLTVSTVNGLGNAPTASGPTPSHAPHYAEFARVSKLLRELQMESLLEIGYESSESELPVTIPLGRTSLPDIVEARSAGYGVRLSPEGLSVTLTQTSRSLVWRIPPEAKDNPAVSELVELLGLQPGLAQYEIRLSVGGRPEAGVKAGERTQINVATRSMMGTLFYVSQAVDVPQAHREKGVVTTTQTPDGEPFDWTMVTGDLLRVHARRLRPAGAAVAVFHRGYWFYIDDADLTSKSTFGLLNQLFALQAGAIESVAPVLTLPVGG